MERRNFFKSLMAADIVITAPKVFLQNEVEVPEKVEFEMPKAREPIPVTKIENAVIKKGCILHKNNVIAEFEDILFESSRDVDRYQTHYGCYVYPIVTKYTFTIGVLDVREELSIQAFTSDENVQIQYGDETGKFIMYADASITNMQFIVEADASMKREWVLTVYGNITIENLDL